jgi:hypothetical protein
MSTVRRYDYARPLSQALKDYLLPLIGDDLTSLVVTWFDPMAVDENARIVCMATRGRTQVESPGNAQYEANVAVKTLWTQATMDADFTEHDRRVNIVFDKLMSATLADDLDAAIADGFGIDFVQPVRDLDATIEGRDAGFLMDAMTLRVHVFSTETPQPVV